MLLTKDLSFRKITSLAATSRGTWLQAGALFVAFSTLTRLALLGKSAADVDWAPGQILKTFGIGLGYDLTLGTGIALVLACLNALLPNSFIRTRTAWRLRGLGLFACIYFLLFNGLAEWLFWDEFGCRYNFIAVDYLVYTREVVGNIWESYPMPLLLGGLGLAAGLVQFALSHGLAKAATPALPLPEAVETARPAPPLSRRLWPPLAGTLALGLLLALYPPLPDFTNNYNRELAKNGIYSFFEALGQNELNYASFYRTLALPEAFWQVKELLSEKAAAYPVDEQQLDNLRQIRNSGPKRRWNIIQITVESLSREYLGIFNPASKLTPNLDRLAADGLLFTNFYATGTRTVRGMEALSLSVPPTPGLSLVRRRDNHGLFSLGSVLQSKSYQTSFIYSGFGYFDNMNHFFAENGFKIIDRATKPASAISFANVWGACDEDLYRWVIEEADQSHAAGQPFFHFVMTTSNHRPYTFPEGKIDMPQGRRGSAVRYTDYAIGEFVRQAAAKPWWNNTLLVIVADHCSSTAGKADLPLDKYRIPLIIYNPELVAGSRMNTLCSQVDYAPTLLGMLGLTYDSRFFGRDIMRLQPEQGRAFVGTHQNLGYLRDNTLIELKPGQKVSAFRINPVNLAESPIPADENLAREAIAYYQTSSYLVNHRLYRKVE